MAYPHQPRIRFNSQIINLPKGDKSPSRVEACFTTMLSEIKPERVIATQVAEYVRCPHEQWNHVFSVFFCDADGDLGHIEYRDQFDVDSFRANVRRWKAALGRYVDPADDPDVNEPVLVRDDLTIV